MPHAQTLAFRAILRDAVAFRLRRALHKYCALREAQSYRLGRGEERLRQQPLAYMRADAIYGTSPRPGCYGPKFWINSQGFPQRQMVRVRRRSGVMRIVCLGESPAFGRDSLRSFPYFLQETLQRNSATFRDYEVINGAVPGWMSDQTALRVKYELAKLKPHVVILHLGLNDFQGYSPRAGNPPVSWFDRLYGSEDWTDDHASTVCPLHEVPLERTPAILYRFLFENLNRIIVRFQTANPAVRFIVCTISARWPKRGSDDWNQTPPYPWWITQNSMSWRDLNSHLYELNLLLRQFAGDRDASVIDFNALFDPLDRYRLYWDPGHLTSRGLEIIAGALYHHMCDAGIVQGRRDTRSMKLQAMFRSTRYRTVADPVS